MNTSKKLILATTITLASCATKGSLKSGDNDKDSLAGQSGRGELVMIQSGGKSPIISSSGENHWTQLRQADESSMGKLNGLLATGDWQAAITEARKQIELQPGDEGIMTVLGAAFAAGRNYEMAGYYGSQALKSNPSNADAMNLVGLRVMMSSENRRGDFDDAIAWFRKATEADGTNVAAPLNMGYLQLDLGDAQGALESFSIASNRCGDCFEGRYGYGVAASRSAAWNNAKTAFEGIISKEPSRAEAIYQLAMVYKNGLNNNNEAVKLLQSIVSDADGRFKDAGEVKRVANVTLRRLRANDRSGPEMDEGIMPRGGEKPARAL